MSILTNPTAPQNGTSAAEPPLFEDLREARAEYLRLQEQLSRANAAQKEARLAMEKATERYLDVADRIERPLPPTRTAPRLTDDELAASFRDPEDPEDDE